jgi:hypothetical protein
MIDLTLWRERLSEKDAVEKLAEGLLLHWEKNVPDGNEPTGLWRSARFELRWSDCLEIFLCSKQVPDHREHTQTIIDAFLLAEKSKPANISNGGVWLECTLALRRGYAASDEYQKRAAEIMLRAIESLAYRYPEPKQEAYSYWYGLYEDVCNCAYREQYDIRAQCSAYAGGYRALPPGSHSLFSLLEKERIGGEKIFGLGERYQRALDDLFQTLLILSAAVYKRRTHEENISTFLDEARSPDGHLDKELHRGFQRDLDPLWEQLSQLVSSKRKCEAKLVQKFIAAIGSPA